MSRQKKNPRPPHAAAGSSRLESTHQSRPHQNQLEVHPQSRPTQIRLCAEIFPAVTRTLRHGPHYRRDQKKAPDIAKLLVELGAVCSEYLDKTLVNLDSKRIQCDEIWSYIAAKEKNVTPKMAEQKFCGDAWTWVAIDADTKLICSWLVAKRNAESASQFIDDLAGRLRHHHSVDN